jgi:CopG family nickel-responsive transcriptional regulator
MRNTESHDEEAGAVRFSVSMEPDLLARFDELLGRGGRTRSKAVRDLVRARLAGHELETGRASAVGVLSFVYDHGQSDLARRLMEVQHGHHAEVVSSTHVLLDRRDCLEVLILRGAADKLRGLADRVLALKGVRQGHLSLNPARCPLAREHHH